MVVARLFKLVYGPLGLLGMVRFVLDHRCAYDVYYPDTFGPSLV